MGNFDKESEIKKNKYMVLTSIIIGIFLVCISFYNIFYVDRSGQKREKNISKYVEILKEDCNTPTKSKESIILLSGKEIDISTKIIENQLVNSKVNYEVYEKLDEIRNSGINPEIIIIDGKEMEFIASKEEFYNLINHGKHIIFSTMPDVQVIDKYNLKEILGIHNIYEGEVQKGIRFLEGFMLGGLMEYENFSYDVPDVELLSTTKVFVSGMAKDSEIVNEELSPLIWRNIYNQSKIFIVNGPFFENNAGYGVLSSILSQIYEDYIYPVVNASAITINGFPSFSNENSEKLQEVYGMNQGLLQQDVIFPSLLALCENNNLSLSCFLTDRYTLGSSVNLELRALNNYKNEILKMDGEIGISDVNSIEEGIKIFKNKFKDRKLNSILLKNKSKEEIIQMISENEDLTEVTTIAGPWKEGYSNIEFLTSRAVFVPITLDGINISDEELLSFYSAITAMGITVQNIELKEIVYPENHDYDWVMASKEYGNYINSYRYKFGMIESENISETGYKIKNFILCNPEITYLENEILIKNEKQFSDNYYILRTDKEIKSISSGEVNKIEDNAYLIKTSAKEVKIKLKYKNTYKY